VEGTSARLYCLGIAGLKRDRVTNASTGSGLCMGYRGLHRSAALSYHFCPSFLARGTCKCPAFFEQLNETDEGDNRKWLGLHLICTKHPIQPLQSAAGFGQHNSNTPGPHVSCTAKRALFLRHVGRCMSNCQRVEGGFLSSKPRGPTRGLEGSPFVPSRPRNVSAKARWIFPAPCQAVHASQRPLRGPNRDSTERS
jgi:hypothetical protein